MFQYYRATYSISAFDGTLAQHLGVDIVGRGATLISQFPMSTAESLRVPSERIQKCRQVCFLLVR